MKIKVPFIILSVLTLFFVPNVFSSTLSAIEGLRFIATADTNDLHIYDDQLESNFLNWSWNSNVSLDDSSSPNSGSKAIAFTASSWGGLYLHTETSLSASDYDTLNFSLKTTQPDQKFAVGLYDESNQLIQTPTPLHDLDSDPTPGSYKQYSIPLSRLNPANKSFKGFVLQNISGQNQPIVYVDDIFLKGKVMTPTITPTPTMTPQSSLTPTPVSTSSSTQSMITTPIYADSLDKGYENWSWGSSVTFDATTHVYRGSKAISFTPYDSWAGFYLFTKTPIDTSTYSAIKFSVFATSPDQKLSVALHDENNQIVGNPIPLSSLGDLVQDKWRTYTIPFSAFSSDQKKITGFILQETSGKSEPVMFIDEIDLLSVQTTSSTTSSTTNTTPSTPSLTQSSTSGDPLSGSQLFVEQNTNAKKTADDWRSSGRTSDADMMMKIANNPTAFWAVGNDSVSSVSQYVSQASGANAIPVIVAYNIPGRDCGQYSQGGSTYDGYKSWIDGVAGSIGDKKAVVILEPDALGLDCLQNDTSYSLLKYAVDTLSARSATSVYVEAATWVSADTMAGRLAKVDIGRAQGFAINTSGFNTTDAMVSYGNSLSGKVGGKHFIIDTSRNGNGPYDPSQADAWCNPPDRALGNQPTTNTGNPLVDAYLWVKVPGESDGSCRGGPSAGSWWADYALGLAKNAHF